jgi:predicted dehydrogenase
MDRVRVGVLGTGVIAQVMHLHFLRELQDRFDVVSLCDISQDLAARCAREYGVPAVYAEWKALLDDDIDAVLVLTSGSHAQIAIEAARLGRHVFVEKPMCFSVEEGRAMVASARDAGVVLMVGYPKRYDPAFARFREEVARVKAPKFLRVTTFESPSKSYVGHYPLIKAAAPAPADAIEQLQAESAAIVRGAIGTDDPFYVRSYLMVLLDTVVHEINTVRGVLGEPDRLEYVDLRDASVTALLTFGHVPVAIHWIDLPGISRYLMEFAFYGDDRRVGLSFPSPFLRNSPTMLTIEGGTPDDPSSWRTEEMTSYESAFRRELEVFHEAVTGNTDPPTDGEDGLRDVALCTAMITAARERRPVDRPTDLAIH